VICREDGDHSYLILAMRQRGQARLGTVDVWESVPALPRNPIGRGEFGWTSRRSMKLEIVRSSLLAVRWEVECQEMGRVKC
jgi:hypothetical protein